MSEAPPPDEGPVSAGTPSGWSALAGAFTEQRDRLRRLVAARIDRRIAGRVDPSDVLQDAYLDGIRHLRGQQKPPPFSLWRWVRFLVGQRLMALHRWHLGTRKRDPRLESRPPAAPGDANNSRDHSWGLPGRLTTPSREAVCDERQARLFALLEALPPSDQEILLLRHFEELSNEQAAVELAITPAAASKRYVRALERLRAAAAPHRDLIDP